ncbi:hypothetical protein GCM10025770_25750 [Viridibacterium curvum]|uniref:Secreted protein n=1 Tax=Viridibacterium curvum TaxID=1101404 RepID=A0ABP9QTZ5_9RHOO
MQKAFRNVAPVLTMASLGLGGQAVLRDSSNNFSTRHAYAPNNRSERTLMLSNLKSQSGWPTYRLCQRLRCAAAHRKGAVFLQMGPPPYASQGTHRLSFSHNLLVNLSLLLIKARRSRPS